MKDPLQIFNNIILFLKKFGSICEMNSRFKAVFNFKSLRC